MVRALWPARPKRERRLSTHDLRRGATPVYISITRRVQMFSH